MISTWLTVFIIAFFVVVSPGPNLAITLRNSLAYSRRSGIYTVVGISAGSLVHITYCLLGIGVIISQSILLFNTIKWMGALYLIYIGLKSVRAKKQEPQGLVDTNNKSTISPWKAFQTGLLTDLLNPKTTLFFLALFTQIVEPKTPFYAQITYGLTMIIIKFVWYSLMALLITLPLVRNRFLSISHWVERVTGFILVTCGLRLATADR